MIGASLAARRVLGVDIEAKRLGSDWGSGRWMFKEMLCAAMRFEDETKASFLPFDFTPKQLDRWVEPLRGNILAVAHNGLYDIDGVHGTLIALGLDGLPPVLLSDTLKLGPKTGGWARRDLGSMAARYGITAKGSISNSEWDLAHSGDQHIRDLVRAYNENDVDVVLELRRAMLAKGHLRAPRIWRP